MKTLSRRGTLPSVHRHFFRRDPEEREVEEELAAHVELLAEEKVAPGMAPGSVRNGWDSGI